MTLTDASTAATIAGRLAAFASAFGDDLPARIAADSRRRLLDTLGVSLAAVGSGPAATTRQLARSWGGTPAATALGLDERLPAPTAALVNGTLAHALDFDDTHVPSILHPSASVVPAALAPAERCNAPGSRLLAGIAIGNEIAMRLGNAGYDRALGNSTFFERGLHATSICGTIGSAVAAAVVMGLDEVRIAHAMGIAASMGAGLLEANRAGGTVKRIHCGWAAHSGVTAAEMAAHGLTGPPSVFEGRFGFFNAYCGDTADTDAVLDGLGEAWELDRLFIKPYPTNVFTHTGIDAAIAFRERGVRPEDVESVVLGVPAPVMRTIAQPRLAKVRPESGYHAQFSGPFTFAIALGGGAGLGVYLDDFTDAAVGDPVLLGVASRVWHVADDRCAGLYPMQFATVAKLTLRDGRVLTEEVLANRGTQERPLSEQEIALKFRLNAERGAPGQAETLMRRIAELGERDSRDLLADLHVIDKPSAPAGRE